jgi:hypothetical protein
MRLNKAAAREPFDYLRLIDHDAQLQYWYPEVPF